MGLGHFYRSYNLALELKKNNYLIDFIHLPSVFWSSISRFDFNHFSLNIEKSNRHMFKICLEGDYDILYVDGILEFKESEVKSLENKVKIIFYQNLSNARHLSDVFILPSIHQQTSFFNKFDLLKTSIFKGLKYFTFNQSISKIKPRKLNEIVQEVGIICGGSDPRNVMLSLYHMLRFTDFKTINFNFYYGNNYMHKESLPVEISHNINFLEYDIKKIIKSDILISLFGVSTYEFMALGLPILSLGHQSTNAYASKYLAKETGAIIHLGLIDDVTATFLNINLKSLVNDFTKRKELSEKSRNIIDLKGIYRVVDIIENL